MFNLIKMEMHRLTHSTVTWITIIFAILTAIFGIAMTDMDIQAAQDEPPTGLIIQENTDDESTGMVAGVYVTGNPEWANGKIELGDLVGMELQSGLTSILCVIFVALFANADQKNGFIKNIAGQFPRRSQLVLSKFVAIAIHIFVLLAIFSAVTAAFGYIFWGDKVYLASLLPFIKVLGVQYLLHLGLSTLMMFLTILTRSAAFGMTTGILICSGLTAFLYSGINRVVANLRPSWNFDISNYMLESNMRLINVSAVSDTLLRGAIVGIVFLIASLALAMMTMKKRDVR